MRACTHACSHILHGSMANRDANIYLRDDQIDRLDDLADDDDAPGDSRSELARIAVDDLLDALENDGGTV